MANLNSLPFRGVCRVLTAIAACVACVARPEIALDGSSSSTTAASTSAASTSTADDVDGASGDTDSEDVDSDGPPVDLPLECDVLLQDCPQGSKCIPNANLQHSCSPIVGNDEMGEACTLNWAVPATDTCGAGLFCWDLGCTPLCEGPGDPPTCPVGFSCVVSGQFLGLCAPISCNPLQPDCPFDWPCIGLSTEAVCVFSEGAGHGNVPVGESCEPFTVAPSCVSSATCVLASTVPDCPNEGCCTGWCDPDNPQACEEQPGTVCVTSVDESYGFCGLP